MNNKVFLDYPWGYMPQPRPGDALYVVRVSDPDDEWLDQSIDRVGGRCVFGPVLNGHDWEALVEAPYGSFGELDLVWSDNIERGMHALVKAAEEAGLFGLDEENNAAELVLEHRAWENHVPTVLLPGHPDNIDVPEKSTLNTLLLCMPGKMFYYFLGTPEDCECCWDIDIHSIPNLEKLPEVYSLQNVEEVIVEYGSPHKLDGYSVVKDCPGNEKLLLLSRAWVAFSRLHFNGSCLVCEPSEGLARAFLNEVKKAAGK